MDVFYSSGHKSAIRWLVIKNDEFIYNISWTVKCSRNIFGTQVPCQYVVMVPNNHSFPSGNAN